MHQSARWGELPAAAGRRWAIGFWERDNQESLWRFTLCPHLSAIVGELIRTDPIKGIFFEKVVSLPYHDLRGASPGASWENEVPLTGTFHLSPTREVEPFAGWARALMPDGLLAFEGVNILKTRDHTGDGLRRFHVMNDDASFPETGMVLIPVSTSYQEGELQVKGLRSAVEYDLFHGMATGALPALSCALPPDHRFPEALIEELETLFGQLQAYQPMYDGAEFVGEIAILPSVAALPSQRKYFIPPLPAWEPFIRARWPVRKV